jgi:hypothetical protein
MNHWKQLASRQLQERMALPQDYTIEVQECDGDVRVVLYDPQQKTKEVLLRS